MMQIIIISVGKIKERYWQEAINEYIKRLRPYSKIKFIEIAEEKFRRVTERRRITTKEGKKILKVIPQEAMVIALDKVGLSFTSEKWAEKLREWSQFGQKIVFIIGGPLGLSSEVLNKAQITVSLSQMTFTHQMSRVILLEQIYRGLTILRGVVYHY